MWTEDQIPKCKKCGKRAMTVIARTWFCGQCIVNHIKKLEEEQVKAILEE